MSKRVLLAMSGGIDSTVALILLKEQGYEVVGLTYRTFDSVSKACWEKETGCCTIDAIMEAKANAEKFGIEHHILDLREKFDKTIINNFVFEYLAGRTPNPCVECNSTMKWGEVLKKADELNCDYIATGHYAKVLSKGDRYFLQKGEDERKDQTYFLWALSQNDLARTIFPLGNLKKDEVRKIALKNGMEKLVKKRESQEICFIPDNDYRRFIRERIPDIDERIGPGKFVDIDGKIIGSHSGYPFYTIGQRKGLNIAMGYPVYVTKIDSASNTLTLGEKKDLLRSSLKLSNINLMKFGILEDGLELTTKIRYNNKGTQSKIFKDGDFYRIDFEEPVSGVTPGQSAVFYQNNDVVGGGVIFSD